jgi:hypothetical protein
VNANDATTTVFCKVEGCENEARATRGRYALLCDDHIKDARSLTEKLVGVHAEDAAAKPAKKLGLAEHAKRLVPAARQLEHKVTARRTATGQARAALEQFNEELTLIKQSAQELLGG